MTQRWRVDELHALVLGDRLAGIAAVDRHVVTTLHEALTDLLDGRLKAPIGRGYATRAHQGDLHPATVPTAG